MQAPSSAVDNSTAEHFANSAVNIEPSASASAAVRSSSGGGYSGGPGQVSLMVRGGGGVGYVRDLATSTWSPYQSFGGVTTSGIAAAATSTYAYVVARGDDNAVWANRRLGSPTGPWSGWHSLGGVASSDPIVTALGSARGRPRAGHRRRLLRHDLRRHLVDRLRRPRRHDRLRAHGRGVPVASSSSSPGAWTACCTATC